MTKREMAEWQRTSIEQAVVRLTMERYTELMEIQRFAGFVA
jgi:hypothetical protein